MTDNNSKFSLECRELNEKIRAANAVPSGVSPVVTAGEVWDALMRPIEPFDPLEVQDITQPLRTKREVCELLGIPLPSPSDLP
jgi:hypothetical protein